MNTNKPFFRKETFTKEKRAKKYLLPIVVVIAVLLAFSSIAFTAVSASGSTGGGDSEPCETIATGTIPGGGIYFDMEGDFHGCGRDCTFTYHNVPSNVTIARIYVGVWMGLGCTLDVTLNGYEYPPIDLSNPPPWAKVTCTGCEVVTVGFDATSHVVPGDNTANAVTIGSCDGRLYGIGLLVVYENESMPELQYWISEGAPVIQHGGACCGNSDEFDIAFGGSVYRGSASNVIYWNMGYPNLILPYYLNGNDISNLNPDYGKGGDRYDLEKYSDIPISYLANADNLFNYYDPLVSSYMRVCTAVLGVEYERSDLTVTNISVPTLYADISNTINATILNNLGNISSNGFNVTLYAGNKSVGVQHLSNMSVGESKEVSFLWKPDHEGSYVLHVIADVDNVVLETDKTNNLKTKKVDVIAAPGPVWQSQTSSVSSIPVGGAIELRAQGKSSVGLDYTVLHTNETGTWKECNDYGSPMEMGSIESDSFTHTSDADWNAQTLNNLCIASEKVTLERMVGTTNIALNKPAYAVQPSKDPSLAVDGITFTEGGWPTYWWVNKSLVYPPWWWYVDLGEVRDIGKIYVDFGFIGESCLATYTIDISNDGTEWVTKITRNPGCSETFTGLDWSARYIRVSITDTGFFSYAGIGEFEVYPLVDYKPAGTLTSTTTATENPIISVTPMWNANVPANTLLSVNISVDDGATWKSATNGEELTWNCDPANTNLKYKVLFETTDINETPVLHDITLNYKVKGAPTNTWVWSNFTWHNPSITNKTVGWQICYTDVLGQTACTNVMTFDVVGPDTTPPYTEGHDPAPEATGVPRNTNITVHVRDDGDGANKGTIVMTVNESTVTPDITGNKNDYTLMYNPPSDFDSGQAVNVTVDASDLASNTMPQDSYSFTIASENIPPVADAGPDQTAAIGATVTFNGSGSYDPDGSIVSYDWDFGDGSTGTGAITTHGYSTDGTYTVTLTVTDNEGAIDNDTAVVTVNPPGGYTGNHPLTIYENGTINGGLVYETITDGSGYTQLWAIGSATYSQDITISIPEGATVKTARLYNYYTWSKPDFGNNNVPGVPAEADLTFSDGTTTWTRTCVHGYPDDQIGNVPNPIYHGTDAIHYWDTKGQTYATKDWDFPSGTIAWDVTDMVTSIGGTYTATITNVDSTPTPDERFVTFGFGLLVVYEAANSPKIKYEVAEGCDILMARTFETPESATTSATFGGVSCAVYANLTTVVACSDKGTLEPPQNMVYFNGVEIGPSTAVSDMAIGVDYFNVTGNLQTSQNMAEFQDRDDYETVHNAFMVVEVVSDTTPPTKVTGVTVTTVSISQLNVSWAGNTESDLDHYNAYRSETAGFTPCPGNLVASSTTNSYSDTGLTANTTYYYRVTALDTSGNEGTPSDEASGTTTAEEVVDDKANADIPVKGTVTGSYVDTHVSDNVCEAIEERESGGKPTNRYSYLEHKWTIDVTGGTDATFYVEAYHTANGEGDDFVFEYSKDDSTYTPMVTVIKTADDDTYQTYSFTEPISGTVYIRVQDTDRTAGNKVLDTISIDHMFILSVLGTPDTTPPAALADLAASDPTSSAITLTWTAPGNDGNTGTATSYDIRYSTSTITDANWDSAAQCTGEPAPQPAGSSETFTVTGLDASTTYYFAIKTSDEVPNESPLSNVASNTTTEAPANAMHVASIDMTLNERTAGPNTFTHATATVTIADANGIAVEGATVSGHWSGATSDTDSGTTDASGQVSLDSDEVKSAASGTTFTFTVDDMVLTGWTYDSAANVETSDSISVQ